MLERIRRWFKREPAAPPAPEAPIDVQALLEPAAAALLAGRSEEAISTLQDVVWRHPRLADGHRLLAEALAQHGDLEDARDSFTLALHFEPESWMAHFGLGLLELRAGSAAIAIPSFEQALANGGESATVLNTLGAACVEAGDHARAIEFFRRAIELDPQFGDAYSNLGYLLFREREAYAEGGALIEQAMTLGADPSRAKLNWAMVLQLRGEVDRARAVYDELIASAPDLSAARLNRALIDLARGDFEQAWPDYEARRDAPTFARRTLPAPEWDGSDLTGRSIAIYPEQGLGDEIMFASCIPDVMRAARSVAVVCHPKLAAIFRRSFPDAMVFSSAADPESTAPPADWSVYVGGLPRFLRRRAADFPAHRGYLRADPARIAYWRSRLGELPGRRSIGLSWRGGSALTRRSLRSIPLEQWAPLLRIADCAFVSLQYTDCAEELAALSRDLGITVHHWPEALDDYDETAALVCALDAVVSVQTAVVHLAGALGVPVRALIPEVPEWRYGERGETMPWYPSVRLMRKRAGETWGDVLGRTAQDLQSHAEQAHPTNDDGM
jgi:tetratricopeptide (TPR) repeat protein